MERVSYKSPVIRLHTFEFKSYPAYTPRISNYDYIHKLSVGKHFLY